MSQSFQLISSKEPPATCCKNLFFFNHLHVQMPFSDSMQSKVFTCHQLSVLFLPGISNCFLAILYGHQHTSHSLKTSRHDAARLCCQNDVHASSIAVCYSPGCSCYLHHHPASSVCTESFRSSASTRMSPRHCCCTEPAGRKHGSAAHKHNTTQNKW